MSYYYIFFIYLGQRSYTYSHSFNTTNINTNKSPEERKRGGRTLRPGRTEGQQKPKHPPSRSVKRKQNDGSSPDDERNRSYTVGKIYSAAPNKMASYSG